MILYVCMYVYVHIRWHCLYPDLPRVLCIYIINVCVYIHRDITRGAKRFSFDYERFRLFLSLSLSLLSSRADINLHAESASKRSREKTGRWPISFYLSLALFLCISRRIAHSCFFSRVSPSLSLLLPLRARFQRVFFVYWEKRVAAVVVRVGRSGGTGATE